MPDIYEYEFRVTPQRQNNGYSNLTHRIEARETLNGRSQDQFWAVWSVDLAEAAEAELARLKEGLRDFLVPWEPHHYPQLRRLLASGLDTVQQTEEGT